MTAVVRHITFDVAPPYEPVELARFWSEVMGAPLDPETEPGDDEALVRSTPGLLFIRVPEAKTLKNRVHLDVQPGTTRDDEVDRLVALGAKLFEDHRRPDGTGWVTLTDPAGNEFCVERSAAERGE
ncbi:VOC family protein [Actinoplanes sp. NBRC 103695]|uniref:VOC family protein n=1 Tax=Actinoplanes sp. NBRC 103695 TaxID=3032202 RepID=UPI0024A0FC79|nr:VOC family protein [Actinoplanes sp. NBRC 103695]GLY95143.1 glyoxalase [Actinoplanes sp. NBRC 103695]